MIAWLLVFGILGHGSTVTIPGIASERACQQLAQALYRDALTTRPPWRCYPYRPAASASPFRARVRAAERGARA